MTDEQKEIERLKDLLGQVNAIAVFARHKVQDPALLFAFKEIERLSAV